MKIVFHAAALDDVAHILDWIGQDNPSSADRVARRMREDIEQLVDYPASGRAGRVAGTRELVINKGQHIAVYRVHETVVQIIAIFSTRIEWPGDFSDRE